MEAFFLAFWAYLGFVAAVLALCAVIMGGALIYAFIQVKLEDWEDRRNKK